MGTAVEVSVSERESKNVSDRDLAKLLTKVLSDRDRPGVKPTFSAEECERPRPCEAPDEGVDVVTGKVIMSTIGPTRTEEDFVGHIDQTVAIDPNAAWASFDSLEALRKRLTEFIEYFNAVLAKPFRWTYAGTSLRVA